MENNKEMTKEEMKALLEELKQKYSGAALDNALWLEEFIAELHLAINIFFEGRTRRDGHTITLTIPKEHKVCITAELI